MNIKTAILLVLIVIAITACVSVNESKTKPTKTIDQQSIAQIEPKNETAPPGTVVQEIKSQIKFNVIPPPGSNGSVNIGN